MTQSAFNGNHWYGFSGHVQIIFVYSIKYRHQLLYKNRNSQFAYCNCSKTKGQLHDIRNTDNAADWMAPTLYQAKPSDH